MKYDLSLQAEASGAVKYLESLIEKGHTAEVKKIVKNRSLKQNNYLHLIIGAFAVHFGYTLSEAKAIYKEINSDIYNYTKKGREFICSSAAISTEDMAKTIDKFRDKSAEAGCPLPLATDQNWLRSIENTIEQQRRYL